MKKILIIEDDVSIADIVSNIDVMKLLSDGEIVCFDTPGEYNDMKKEGVSYYLIQEEKLAELRKICISNFSV